VRFLADGPSIPDELLVARDEGRVIFFCGAGVSRARAALADFFGLARQVLDVLEANPEARTRKLLEAAIRVQDETGINGLVPADRIFGLLEQDFRVTDIQEAVAKALKPLPVADLSAHRTLLDLAAGPDGHVRLVTTNFDLLFEAANPHLKSFSPRRLPDPRRPDDLAGITHLHGKVTDDYTGAADDGFVLSSSEFGHAYISDGWATKFIAALLEQYVVVFVGYAADDPPVQYLLEALNRNVGSRAGLYAFQSGTSDEASSRWLHRGVLPVAYDQAESHKALWDTLAQWAIRARDPTAWYESVIRMAVRGPEVLLPHERGQIVHVVETAEGARMFATDVEKAPADWLCVFDPMVRFSRPRRLGDVVDGPIIDPFELYGLDSDPPPPPLSADDYAAKRPIPEAVKNPLKLTPLDQRSLGPNGTPAISGHFARNVPLLPDRLQQIGTWISSVAEQPAAVWWAADKKGLHPTIQDMIQFQLGRTDKPSSPAVRKAWRLMVEAWQTKRDSLNTPWFDLRAAITQDGWSPAAVRQIADTHRPYLVVQRPVSGSPRPPAPGDLDLRDMISVDVKYSDLDIDVEIPDSMVRRVAREFRRNVEHAVSLEAETGGYALNAFAPIEADTTLEGSTAQRKFELSACILFYVDLFKRLVALDPGAARQEYESWHSDDESVFARLRVWASSDSRVLTGEEAAKLLESLPDSIFWGSSHQRDLLLALKGRWSSMPPESRAVIERRLLAGPPTDSNNEDHELEPRLAGFSLTRLHWLQSQGCPFGFDIEREIARLRAVAPLWKPAYAESAARSLEGQSGWVRTDTAFDGLMYVPLSDLLAHARELSGRSLEGFVEDDPFAGLVAAHPMLAYRALVRAAKRNECPEWAFTTFLNPKVRAQDKPRLTCAIAWRLSNLSTNCLGQIAYSISAWLESSSPMLAAECPSALEAIWSALIRALGSIPTAGDSIVVRRKDRDPDWVTEALNSPVGKLTLVLMQDPRITKLEPDREIPPSWLRSAEQLLSLELTARQHVFSILGRHLNWLYARAPVWTGQQLIEPAAASVAIRDPFWASYFWGGRLPGKSLYERLKPQMAVLIESRSLTRHEHIGFIAAMLLSGWVRLKQDGAPQLVTDEELRDLLLKGGDHFRAQALYHLGQWTGLEDQASQAWDHILPELLEQVWPRHKSAKGSETSAALCDLAFSSHKLFPRIAAIVTDLVSKMSDQHLVLANLQEEDSTIISTYPKEALSLLAAILPDQVSKWPYGIEKTLRRLEEADSSLIRNEQLIELKQKIAKRE
jgi:hypothetical protein